MTQIAQLNSHNKIEDYTIKLKILLAWYLIGLSSKIPLTKTIRNFTSLHQKSINVK